MDSTFSTPELPALSFLEDLADDDRLLLGNYGDLETFVNAYPQAGACVMAGVARLLSKRLRAMNARFATLQEALSTTQSWQ